MKRIFQITSILLLMLATSACNTMEGVGKDIQKAGETLENSAKKK
jgi:predicted small secreted protein